MTHLKTSKFVLIFMSLSLNFACNEGSKTNENTVVTKAAEPAFVDEGDLMFIDSNGKEIAKIDIEIAEKEAERNQGLMYRTHMDEMKGILFIFEKLEPQAFWMRNTYIPLDIIYVNEKKQVVSIQKNAATMNDQSLPSYKAAQYVVEVNAGFADRFGIKEGTKIQF
jgi:uncharacterized protein